MIARAACSSRSEGSPWTGQSRELVKRYPLTLSGYVLDVYNHINAQILPIFSDRVV